MLLDDFQPRPIKPRVPIGQRPSIEPPTHQNSAALKSALDDIEVVDEADIDKPVIHTTPKVKPEAKGRWYHHLNPRTWTKKQAIIISVVAAVLLLGGGAGAYVWLHHSPAPAPVVAEQPKTETPAPVVPITSPLTGSIVTADQAKLPVTGIMIENSTEARPQSGLDQAGVVFEAVAEGGITRFLALFQEDQPDYVGPVRSVRPYYLDWLIGFNASVAHVGGSPDAISAIKTLGVRDLDQFYNSGSYTRITSRASPHNVYTSLSRLVSLEQSKGYAGSSFTSWSRKAAAPAATPSASSIDFAISSADYNSHYDYDAASNSYSRSEGGKPHLQVNSAGQKTQIKANVVIGLVLKKSLSSDGVHTIYTTLGSGQAFIFQDGTLTTATWQKTDRASQISLTDAAGQPVKLNPGRTWISIVDAASRVTYK